MPLQNRVAPDGSLHAVAARGTMLGNRGGRFHRADKTLGYRRWSSRHWICCELHFKTMHHDAMGNTQAVEIMPAMQVKVLTPPSILAILAGGYQPRWHRTALQWDD